MLLAGLSAFVLACIIGGWAMMWTSVPEVSRTGAGRAAGLAMLASMALALTGVVMLFLVRWWEGGLAVPGFFVAIGIGSAAFRYVYSQLGRTPGGGIGKLAERDERWRNETESRVDMLLDKRDYQSDALDELLGTSAVQGVMRDNGLSEEQIREMFSWARGLGASAQEAAVAISNPAIGSWFAANVQPGEKYTLDLALTYALMFKEAAKKPVRSSVGSPTPCVRPSVRPATRSRHGAVTIEVVPWASSRAF